MLGYINPDALAGGTMPIQGALSHAAVGRVADGLGMAPMEAAWAVHVVAAASMMRAVKAVSTYRGRNPADFALMAFGGNGGVFAVSLARQLQIARVIVPPAAGVFSAVGLLLADWEFGLTRAFLRRIGGLDPAALEAAYGALAEDVAATVAAGEYETVRTAALRYAGQAFELTMPAPAGMTLAALAEAFEAEHARTYGHRLTDADGIDIVAIGVTLVRRTPQPSRPGVAPAASEAEGRRRAFFGPDDGWHDTPVIGRFHLGAAPRPGPLIVEEYEGTTVVPPGATAWLDGWRNILIDTGEGA